MTDTSVPPPPASSPACRKKKTVCLLIALAIVILAGAPAVLYFCPWLSRSPAGDASQMETRLSDIDRRVQLLENRFQELSGRVSSTPVYAPSDAKENTSAGRAADVARMQSDLVTLSSALSALQAEVKRADAEAMQSRAATQVLLGGAIAFIQLRDAALSGHSFNDELVAFRAAADSDVDLQKAVAQLEPHAAQGAPSFAELREGLIAREAGATNDIEKAHAQNWWQRILVELKGLVSVRPLHGNELSDGFAALEADLDKNDAAAAEEAYKNLAPEAQEALADWHARLQARAAIDEALHTLAAHFVGGGTSPAKDTP